MRTTVSLVGALLAAALSLASCATPARPTLVTQSAETEARIAALVARMPVERKVAQLVMPDISTVTSDDVRRYRVIERLRKELEYLTSDIAVFHKPT